MPTLTVDEKVVFDWLDSWWPVVSSWLPDPEPLIGPKWDTLVYKAAAVIPEELHGVDLQPLKELLYAMVAFGEPSDINGLKPTADEIRDRSSKAWRTYQRLTALVQNRITQEKSEEKQENQHFKPDRIGEHRMIQTVEKEPLTIDEKIEAAIELTGPSLDVL